ncbi:MgtC/SapB family protein [Vibrio astriarenae]|uniref:Protein MgtC n=1 Tax=Vibrio astriarenae TaxID=1481923 RepID=A0A7Z2T520_9VIBR|nr:MgtC/SapB family protein [Vibrio astriarenae]QIA64395.1 MgtC/SapB family protein [Vibrio astriarenae]
MDYLISQIVDIAPFEWAALLCCAINGLMIGIERQTRGKPVGIRTSILIIAGTYMFMTLAKSLSVNSLDHARVLGQIITGVGFLGAGVMMTRDGKIHGVTSAAIIWLLAALGMTIGLGYWHQSVVLTLFALLILLGVDKAENQFKALRRGVHQKIQLRRKTRTKVPRSMDKVD